MLVYTKLTEKEVNIILENETIINTFKQLNISNLQFLFEAEEIKIKSKTNSENFIAHLISKCHTKSNDQMPNVTLIYFALQQIIGYAYKKYVYNEVANEIMNEKNNLIVEKKLLHALSFCKFKDLNFPNLNPEDEDKSILIRTIMQDPLVSLIKERMISILNKTITKIIDSIDLTFNVDVYKKDGENNICIIFHK